MEEKTFNEIKIKYILEDAVLTNIICKEKFWHCEILQSTKTINLYTKHKNK